METNDYILRFIPSKYRPYIVLGGGVICMMSLAIVYSFGGVPFSMLIGGIVEESIGGRCAAIIGCLLYTCSIFFSSIVLDISYGWLLFSFGFLPSFGQGIAYNAVLITAQRWFPNNIGFASGVIVAGFGCGTLFIAPLQTLYVNPYHYTTNGDGYFTQDDLLDRVPNLFVVMAIFFSVLQIIGLTLLGSPIEDDNDSMIDDDNRSLLDESPSLSVISRRDMIMSSSFLFIFFTLFFMGTWVQITTGLYKAYGLQFISSDHFLSMIAAVSSIFNCGSRIGWGWLADKTSYQKTMVLSSLLAAFITWTLPLIKYIQSPILFLSSVCGLFICVGGVYSLLPFISSKLFGTEHFGVMYGLIQLALSLSGVVSGLFGQFLLPYLGYDRLFLISGFFPIISFILTSLIHLTPLVTLRTNRSLSPIVPL